VLQPKDASGKIILDRVDLHDTWEVRSVTDGMVSTMCGKKKALDVDAEEKEVFAPACV
jgi:hypothetical protein